MRAMEEELPSHHTTRQIGKYIWFRISKNLDIEPETLATNDKMHNHHHHHHHHVHQCVCGYEGEEDQSDDDDEEFLSACEVENWVDSSESGDSSASSFAFPVLDARWSGSPVQMPQNKSDEHKNKLGFLRKPKLAARFVCRWCRSF